MTRLSKSRALVGWTLATSVLFAVGTEASHLPNRIAAGDVSASSAVLWARLEAAGTATFFYSVLDPEDGLSAWQTQMVDVLDPTVPAKVEIHGLAAGTVYVYGVTADSGMTSDLGSFRTPHLSGLHRGLRFGVSGDSRGELGPYPSIRNAPARDSDFFVMLGDTIYADVPSNAVPTTARTLVEFRRKHEEVLSEQLGMNAFGDLRSSTALYATTDDHEVANDYAGGAHPSTDSRFNFTTETYINETPLFDRGLEAFHEYYPVREEVNPLSDDPRTSEKRRLYRARQFGSDAAIFVLDARSFRDEPLFSIRSFRDFLRLFEFLQGTFDASRTMLGSDQLSQLKSDLLDAEQMGVTWKFVMVPEPIQNLGILIASDRFEGYAAERTEILSFIDQENIKNVVFVAADLHGTLVNNLTYQTAPFGAHNPIDAFEIVTGPVAYDAPLGTTAVELAVAAGILPEGFKRFYDGLPRKRKDVVVEILGNVQMAPFGFSPLGLRDSTIDVDLVTGRYVAVHVYGWTEFEIDASSQALTVTVWGIDAYSADDLANDPGGVLGRVPEIVTRFVVTPK